MYGTTVSDTFEPPPSLIILNSMKAAPASLASTSIKSVLAVKKLSQISPPSPEMFCLGQTYGIFPLFLPYFLPRFEIQTSC